MTYYSYTMGEQQTNQTTAPEYQQTTPKIKFHF
jgi:hypothetical protein